MPKTDSTQTFADYLTVAEAAELVGVSPWTLRNWDKAGKLKPERHPVNGYRIYRREDLEAILGAGALLGKRKGTLAPNLDWNEFGASEHFVQFYETDAYLVESVSGFLTPALMAGAGAIAIATPDHRKRIEKKLKSRGIDVSEAARRGQYVPLDAAETLAKFMDGDSPDPERFTKAVGEIIARLAEGWPRVRAFGEMVALLWEEGNRDAACRLESLWNDLAKEHSFSLFCAYPLSEFSDEMDGAPFSEVCKCHSRVIPAESYAALSTSEEQLRAISVLQQKAKALEAEVALRKHAERELSDFVENALEGLHTVGPDGTIIWANKAELDLLGYEPDEYIGRHIAEFHVDGEVIDDILRRLLKGENLFNRPARLRCKDGSVKHVLIHSNAYFEGGRFIHSRCFTRDVTEVKQADRDRAMLAAIIESSDDAIISKTLDGIIRSWNAGAERLFGYSESEAVGQPITLIIPPELHREEKSILERLRQGERIEHYETVRVAKDGARLDISLTISPLRDSEGNFIGASKVARDITEHKQAEKKLRQSEERYRHLAELLPVAVYTCEAPSGVITYYNSNAAQLWGRAPRLGEASERFCGSSKLRQVDGTLIPHEKCPMAVALRDGQSFRNQDVMVERPDGSRINVLVNVDPIRNDSGAVVGAVNVFHDITALKQAEEALRESQEQLACELAAIQRLQATSSSLIQESDIGALYQKIVDAAADIMRSDFASMQVVDEERNALRMLAWRGFGPEFGKIFEVIGPDMGTSCSVARRTGRRVIVSDVETCDFIVGTPALEDHRRTGIRAVQSTPLISRTGEILGIISTHWQAPYQPSERDLRLLDLLTRQAADLLDRSQAEQALRDADRRKDEFLATLAHELRNPLAPIRTGLEVMKLAKDDPATVEEIRNTMERQTEQLIMLVDDLLDVSRITRSKLELRKCRVKLSDVTQSAVEASKPFIDEAGHELTVLIPGEPIHLDADPHRLAQVVSNLLNNAAKYTPEGGRIWLTAERQGSDVVISVTDTGIGIPADMLDRIFEMFAQIDHPIGKSYSGLGIGLTLVKSLVETHGGSVEVRSEGPNRGSEFRVRLPILIGMVAEEKEPVQPDASSTTSPKRRVLVVDDNEAAAEMLSIIVKMLGNEVRTAGDGQQGIEIAAEFLPDVVLMDLGMPKLNGYEAAGRIRQQPWGEKMMLVALTGWGQEEDKQRTKEAGFDHHLVKPAEPAELQRLLKEMKQPSAL